MQVDIWVLYQKGLSAFYESSEIKTAESIGYFDKINDLDPKFVPALAMGAIARMILANVYRGDDLETLSRDAKEKAEQGYSIDPSEPLAMLATARIHSGPGDHEAALDHAR